MKLLQEIFCQYGPEYLAVHGEAVPERQRRVLDSVMKCGSGECGYHVFGCAECGHQEVVACCCGDRHCPVCQNEKGSVWLEEQLAQLLPCGYFLITFTVPEELRPFLRSHQDAGYEAMFAASAGALKKLSRDRRFIGADQIGFLGVLHTWGRTLQYHPHIHMVVPGGGLSGDRKQWIGSRSDLFVHVRPLSVLYRGKFREAMKKAGLLEQIDPAVWQKDWNVNSQAVGEGRATLTYLAGYVSRVAISDRRIVSVQDGRVTFRYRDSKTNRERTMTVWCDEFLRRFLQHVLPAGFVKIRHFGFLSPNAATPLDQIRRMIWQLCDMVTALLAPACCVVAEKQGMCCLRCGGRMRWVRFVPVLRWAG